MLDNILTRQLSRVHRIGCGGVGASKVGTGQATNLTIFDLIADFSDRAYHGW